MHKQFGLPKYQTQVDDQDHEFPLNKVCATSENRYKCDLPFDKFVHLAQGYGILIIQFNYIPISIDRIHMN